MIRRLSILKMLRATHRVAPTFLFFLLLSCQKNPALQQGDSSSMMEGQMPSGMMVAPDNQGEVVYRTNCIACHNTDPSKDGSVGPAIAGSSKELLKARLVDGNYPAGYTPKRDSHLMPQFPYLEKDIDALVTYLNKK